MRGSRSSGALLLLWLSFCVPASAGEPIAAAASARDAWARLPLRFEPNRGQADGAVQFLARTDRDAIFLGSAGVVLRLGGSASTVLEVQLVGAHRAASLAGVDPLPGRTHYLLGDDRSRWHTEIPTYGRVAARDVYRGIDLLYHGSDGQLEYDFDVAAGTDPSRIRMRFDGADAVRIDADGTLVVEAGGRTLRQAPPFAYQEIDGARRTIASGYRLVGRREVAFSIARFDRAHPLVIDPIMAYSTYFGSSGDENPADDHAAIAVDPAGNVYLAGYTDSLAFPTVNPAQPQFGGGTYDVFLVKLDPSASSVVYSTYLGGTGDEVPHALRVDAAGNATVVGETASLDFPLSNPLQASFAGGPHDGFVARLDETGSALRFSTYLGGNSNDAVFAVALDPLGDALVAGATGSSNFPITADALQASLESPPDAFVAELDPAGTGLLHSTYLGGTGVDAARGIAVDGDGMLYVAGGTTSTDFPTESPVQGVNHGDFDAFAAKLDLAGAQLVYSTYFGGAGTDFAIGMGIDEFGYLLLGGNTSSSDLPLLNAAQPAFAGGRYDAFAAKLDPSGTRLVYATYAGGSNVDDVHAVTVDAAGNLFVGGHTASSDFPLVGAVQSSYGGGMLDGYLVKVGPSGAISFSTLLGGTGIDGILGVVTAASGDIHLVGATTSTDFPTLAPLQPANAGHEDLVVAKLHDIDPEVVVSLADGAPAPLLTVSISNPGSELHTVDLKLWIDAPELGLLAGTLPSPTIFSMPAGFGPVQLVTGLSLPTLLPFPGTRIGAALSNPVTGQQISRSVCVDVPCN